MADVVVVVVVAVGVKAVAALVVVVLVTVVGGDVQFKKGLAVTLEVAAVLVCRVVVVVIVR